MKKDIVNACIFLLIIVLVASLCSCPRIEGFATEEITSPIKMSLVPVETDAPGIIKVIGVIKLTNANLLFSTDNPMPDAVKASDANSSFCAFIDDTSNSLKIAKKPKANEPQGKWQVIWDSKVAGFTGSELKMVDNVLHLGNMQLGAGKDGTYAKLTIEGDLVICNDAHVTVWSLVANQLDLITQQTNEYLNMSSRIDRSFDINNLSDSYANLNTYVNSLNLTDRSLYDVTYKKLVRIRHRMDFEIKELNGVSNSKINTSNEMLQSTMYLNLGIAVLVTSVFILISTR